MTLTHFPFFLLSFVSLSVSSIQCLVNIQSLMSHLLCAISLMDLSLPRLPSLSLYFLVCASLPMPFLFCSADLPRFLYLGTVVLPVHSCLLLFSFLLVFTIWRLQYFSFSLVFSSFLHSPSSVWKLSKNFPKISRQRKISLERREEDKRE